MKQHRMAWVAFYLFVLSLFSGCGGWGHDEVQTKVAKNFESASIGQVEKIANTEWELSVANDNGDASLPASWRSWWYFRMENPDQNAPTKITLKNSGWPYYYLPLYSYDQKTWFQFAEAEVTQNAANELVLQKQFGHNEVWLARFYPYTFTDLQNYLESIQNNPHVSLQIPGYSQAGKPLYVLKVTNASVPAAQKKRIVMHARTHPAETSTSFLIEGLMARLLSGSQEAAELLARFEFHIFPMQNVDGVIAGNYRSTPKSENLEVLWTFDSASPLNLSGNVPPEVAVIHRYFTDLMGDGGPPVSIALNLHASNSEPDIRTFFYPHFGPTALGYSPVEASLWDKQLLLISKLAKYHGPDLLEPVPEEGGSSFASKTYPESWWWANDQDRVLAMTLEMTYGRAGYAPRWIGPADMRDLGAALVLAIRDYDADPAVAAKSLPRQSPATPSAAVQGAGVVENSGLQFPALYPPRATDELKQ